MLPKELLALLEDKDDAENREELEITLLTLLRFSPIEEVDNFVAWADEPDFPLSLELKDKLEKSYNRARLRFFTMAPYFSRYSSPAELAGLNAVYYDKQDSSFNLKETCQRDMAYGEERERLAQRLLVQLESETETFVPEEFQFSALPASSKGTTRAAALMEKIAEWSYGYQGLHANEDTEAFKTLRRIGRSSYTPMGGSRYAWGKNLTEAVIKYSRSINMTIDRTGEIYSLTYPTDIDDLVVTRVECVDSLSRWLHGRAPLSDTWAAIENLFEKIWTMNLREASKEKMREFYSAVAELVWLIGNSQPMMRGSGSVAEIIMAVLHRHHKLNPPILKLDFPQLDVLDISFPLDDYQYMFPYFFEPRTLPPSLQLDPLKHGGSMVAELKEIYRKKNSDPVAICEQIKNRVCRELNKEIFHLEENKKKPFSECDQKRYEVLLQLKDDLMNIPPDFSKKDCIIDTYRESFNQTIRNSLDKLQWGEGLCNALLVLTFSVSAPVKRVTTGSFFLNTEGKSEEAVDAAPKILKK